MSPGSQTLPADPHPLPQRPTRLDLVPPGGPGLGEAVQEEHEWLAAAQAVRGHVQPAARPGSSCQGCVHKAGRRTLQKADYGSIAHRRLPGTQLPHAGCGGPHLTPLLSTIRCSMPSTGSGKVMAWRSTLRQ